MLNYDNMNHSWNVPPFGKMWQITRLQQGQVHFLFASLGSQAKYKLVENIKKRKHFHLFYLYRQTLNANTLNVYILNYMSIKCTSVL